MTLCIAAMCDGGKSIVTATDGLISFGDVVGECVLAKMQWLGDWQVMYAGAPSRFSLMIEEIESACLDDPGALSRRHIQDTARQAFRKVWSVAASWELLNPFNVTMEEFKRSGAELFGEKFHDELAHSISHSGSRFEDQLLVTGWGESPNAAMIYEVGPSAQWLHTATGFGAIGSGSPMATTMLLLLGQARHITLAETIFNVACAKFSAEKSSGLDVGQHTAMYVSRKRSDADPAEDHPGQFLRENELQELRELWAAHIKPKIPDEARLPITKMASRLCNGSAPTRDMVQCSNAQARLGDQKMRIYEEVNRAIQQDLQLTKRDSRSQQPSQE